MAKSRIAIVDTGSGNLRSVEKALAAVGADVFVTTHADQVAGADKVVVPGQGAFGRCMAGLSQQGGALRQVVLESIRAGKPYLGICLGLQVLFGSSEEESDCAGLAVIPGKVVRFTPHPPLKIPHMGWNACLRNPSAHAAPTLADTLDGTYFYFVHSFFPVPDDARDVALFAEHGEKFCAAVARDNIFACQFHPEKSQRAGLALLARFAST
jgi:glutamine amidotransferase